MTIKSLLSTSPVQSYPLRFRLLISAISVLSKGRDVMVDYDKVCQLLGGEHEIRNLCFMSYQQLVETACAEGHVDQGKLNVWKWIKLRKALVSVFSVLALSDQMPGIETTLYLLLSLNHG